MSNSKVPTGRKLAKGHSGTKTILSSRKIKEMNDNGSIWSEFYNYHTQTRSPCLYQTCYIIMDSIDEHMQNLIRTEDVPVTRWC